MDGYNQDCSEYLQLPEGDRTKIPSFVLNIDDSIGGNKEVESRI